jgi:hypothetical protein
MHIDRAAGDRLAQGAGQVVAPLDERDAMRVDHILLEGIEIARSHQDDAVEAKTGPEARIP